MSNINIMGSARHNGGTYENIKIYGAGEFINDVHAQRIAVNGSGCFREDVNTKEINVKGSTHIHGDLVGDLLKSYGSLHINGDAEVKYMYIPGSIAIDGDIDSDIIELYGSLNVQGDIEVGLYNARGRSNIDGVLNADQTLLELHGNSSISEIYGESVQIYCYPRREIVFPFKIKYISTGLVNKFLRSNINIGNNISDGKMTVGIIEADNIYLENTTADEVSGKNIIIGPGCKIDRIEYIDKLEIDKNSEVVSKEKV